MKTRELPGETPSHLESGVRDLLDGFQALSTELAKHSSVAGVSDVSLRFALELEDTPAELLDTPALEDMLEELTGPPAEELPTDEEVLE